MKQILSTFFTFILISIFSQVGINTQDPKTTLQIVGKSPSTKAEGLMIPKFTGDEIYSMPIPTGTTHESNLVYATSAASVANQTGVGAYLKGKGFYFWDGNVWSSVDNSTTTINNLMLYVKPMNALMSDVDTYPYNTNSTLAIPFQVPSSPKLKLFDCNFSAPGDIIVVNNPLTGQQTNFVIWDNINSKINVPQQLLGYSITINISLKYQQSASNTDTSRFVAYTGNAVYNGAAGTVTGGQKIKDLMFKKSKTSNFTTIRDELVLSPIIVTQNIIDYGIKLYLGSGDSTVLDFYEPVLTIDFGVVNTTL